MNRVCINDYIKEKLSEKRLLHTYGVRDTAVKLAKLYGADLKKAESAALMHDMFKDITVQEMNEYVREFKLHPKYLNNKNLAHSKVAASVMARDLEIDDEDIINAVSFHTTGRADMSLLEKIIYIADAIEPGRNYPGVEQLRQEAFADLNQACLSSLNKTIELVNYKGGFLDEDTVRAAEYLKKTNLKEF